MSGMPFLIKCANVVKKAFFLTPTITITGIATGVPLAYLLVADRKPIDFRDELHKVDYKKAYLREATIEVSELFQRDPATLSDAQLDMKSKLKPVYDLQVQLNKLDQSSGEFAALKQTHDEELLRIIRENSKRTRTEATFEDRIYLLARHLNDEKQKNALRYDTEAK